MPQAAGVFKTLALKANPPAPSPVPAAPIRRVV